MPIPAQRRKTSHKKLLSAMTRAKVGKHNVHLNWQEVAEALELKDITESEYQDLFNRFHA